MHFEQFLVIPDLFYNALDFSTTARLLSLKQFEMHFMLRTISQKFAAALLCQPLTQQLAL